MSRKQRLGKRRRRGILVAHDTSRRDTSSQQVRALKEGDIISKGAIIKLVIYVALFEGSDLIPTLSPRLASWATDISPLPGLFEIACVT
jgi:hypothetical protein